MNDQDYHKVLDIGMCSKIVIYFLDLIGVLGLLSNHCGCHRLWKIRQEINIAEENIEYDFNIKNLVQGLKKI